MEFEKSGGFYGIGETVTVYLDPETEAVEEGTARIIRCIDESLGGEIGLYEVAFADVPNRTFERVIKSW